MSQARWDGPRGNVSFLLEAVAAVVVGVLVLALFGLLAMPTP